MEEPRSAGEFADKFAGHQQAALREYGDVHSTPELQLVVGMVLKKRGSLRKRGNAWMVGNPDITRKLGLCPDTLTQHQHMSISRIVGLSAVYAGFMTVGCSLPSSKSTLCQQNAMDGSWASYGAGIGRKKQGGRCPHRPPALLSSYGRSHRDPRTRFSQKPRLTASLKKGENRLPVRDQLWRETAGRCGPHAG
jgi:hypothetical protein